jgi:hypothetical protein
MPPIDARIPLQVQVADAGQALAQGLNTGMNYQAMLQQRQEAPIRQQLLQAQVDEIPLRQEINQSALQSSRQARWNDEQASVIKGSAALKPLLDTGNVEGARSFLTARRNSLQGLKLDTTQTDQALQLLDTNPAELQSLVNSNYQAGIATGVLQQGKDYAPTELGKWIAERDSYPEGDPRRAPYDRQIASVGVPADGNKPISVAEGATLVDPKTGDVIYQSPGGTAPDKSFKQATDLRKEFTGLSKDYSQQNAAIGRIAASAKDPSAAGDLALIFNYMKVLDPGSTVREGEFATAQNAGGVPDRAIAAYNKVLSGERLAPSQRTDFVDRANTIFKEAKGQHEKTVKEYTRIANQNGIDPKNVIVDFSTYQPEEELLPALAAPGPQLPGDQAAPQIQEGATATNPKTGQKIIFRGGQWQVL